MNEFLIFYAPFILLITGISVAFFIVLKDGPVLEQEEKRDKRT